MSGRFANLGKKFIKKKFNFRGQYIVQQPQALHLHGLQQTLQQTMQQRTVYSTVYCTPSGACSFPDTGSDSGSGSECRGSVDSMSSMSSPVK